MIVGICGSPRNQATEYVLREAMNELEKPGLETKFFTVRGKRIEFCRHCDYCLENNSVQLKMICTVCMPCLKGPKEW